MSDCTDERCGQGQHLCFKHKMSYWKSSGHNPMSLPSHFRAANQGGYSQRELAADTVAHAKSQGVELLRPSRN